ncbi:MAG: F0F1 ATP synthase subunit epsilon [Gammaproteobacteria bacterium]
MSFVGTDASGAFGLLAGHERMMTVLEFGLARFRIAEGAWHFLALPGGLLYFVDNSLFICAHSFVHSDDYASASAAVSGILLQEDQGLRGLKTSIGHMEKEMIRQLWELRREEP